jgi:hypothetical protein
MSREVAAIIGSGTLTQTYGILPPASRGIEPNGLGVRTGTQVMVANPEDINSVEAFAASGITLGTVPVEVIGPHITALPRVRTVVLENVGSGNIEFSHQSSFTSLDAFVLPAEGTAGTSTRIMLPLMKNVSIYARAATGTSILKMLIY